MKLIDKDALVAEIEKLKGQLLRGACSSQISMQTRCKEESYDEVLALLDAIQEESVSEDLEEAAKKAATQFVGGEEKFFWNDYHKFKAGANWQKQQTINKAAEWLKCAGKYHWYDPIEHNEGFGTDRLIEDYKKYMED